MKNNPLIILLLLLSHVSFSQVIWPVPPFNQQHAIAGTLGEYRNNENQTNPRFHKGTDINGTGNVYPIESGIVTSITGQNTINEKVQVNETKYVHLFSAVTVGTQVTAGVTVLGTIQSGHVHLEEQNRNFLNHQLYPYVDNGNVAPTIYAVSFRKNGHNLLHSADVLNSQIPIDNTAFTILYRKVDIVANIDDPMNGGYNHAAPNTISYEIFSFDDAESVDGPIQNFNFNVTPDNDHSDSCFGYGTTMSNFNYILTSHPINNPAPRFFRTNLRTGENENWANTNYSDAQTNLNATYPDGKYYLHIEATDVDYNNNPNHTTCRDDNFLIDNFLPFVQEVTITSGGLIYSENWSWDDTGNGQLVFSNNNIVGGANGENDVVIHITSSEPLRVLVISILGFNSNYLEQQCTVGATDKEWIYHISKEYIEGIPDGEYTIKLDGTDYAGHALEGFQNTNNLPVADIPTRQDDGSWIPPASTYPDYYDMMHKLTVQHESVLNPDFSASETNIELGDEVQFSDLSSPSSDIISWAWTFEGGNPSSFNGQTPPPIVYNQNGNYDVTLTIENNSAQSFTETKSNYINVANQFCDFIFNQNFNGLDYTVDFNDLSFGDISSWLWDFGDGTTSTDQSPSHLYNYADTYSVHLKVTFSGGNSLTKTKPVNVIGDNYLDIQVFTSNYQISDFTYVFSVEVYDIDPSNTHDIYINFGDGSSSVANGNFQSFTYTYDEPGQSTVYHPYAEVTTKNYMGETINTQTADFMSVWLFPTSYVLDISIGDFDYVQPGGSIKFRATATNAVGQVYWSWRINTNVDDINGFCNPDTDGNCLAEAGFTNYNEPYNTQFYTFPDAGTYIVGVSANDIAGKMGYQEFFVVVGDVEDECIVVDFAGTPCNISTEYVVNTELMQDEVAGRALIDDCRDPVTGRWKYDEIKCVEFYFDGVLDPSNKFEFSHEGGYASANNVFGCTYLSSTELHHATIRAYGGRLGSMDPVTNTHLLEYYDNSKPYSSITKSFNVVDCSVNISITSQSELSGYNGNIIAGNITINPTSGNQITLNSSEILNVKAYNELVMHPGVLISETSEFVGRYKLCPELDCDCYTTKSSEFQNDNSDQNSLSIYPNPTRDKFNVSFISSDDVLSSIEVYNSLGEKVHEIRNIFSSTCTIDILSQTPGLYFVKINSLNQTFNKKVIKQ